MKLIDDIKGNWKLQSCDNTEYSGTLYFQNGKIILELMNYPEFNEEKVIIYGFTKQGKITLMDCYFRSFSTNTSGISIAEITVSYFFSGVHLKDFLFDSCYIRINDFDRWVGVSGFDKTLNTDNNFSISYNKPNPISLYKNDKAEISIQFHFYAPLLNPKSKCLLQQTDYLKIESKEKITIEEFWNQFLILKSFFTLSYFSEIIIEELTFFKSEQPIKCIIPSYLGTELPEKKYNENYLFRFENIQSYYPELFNKWFGLSDSIEPVLSLLIDSFGNRNLILESRFLNLIYGIETFHRRLRNNNVLSSEEHKKKKDKILESCPSEYKNWLKARLNFSNEPTLKDRLIELFEEVDSEVISIIYANPESAIKKIKDSRNYYTHYSSSLQRKALSGSELYMMTERLRVFLLIIMLNEILSESALKEIIKSSSNWLFNHLIEK